MACLLCAAPAPGQTGDAAPRPTQPAPSPELPRGRVIDRVVCAGDPSRSYALYLPSTYTPERRWPIVYVFDSRGVPGNGPMIELFIAGAERFGWIVASSNDSSNLVPMEQNVSTMGAMWTDANARLSLDDRRAYAFGFSGLSRLATTLALTAPGSLAGVIGGNGGFPVGTPPTRETAFPFFGTVGDKDFTYYELLDLDALLEELGLPHRIEIFAGSHQWPPAELMTLALGWMELQAMRRGLRERDPAIVEALWAEDLARAREHEAAGRTWRAWRAYRQLAADYGGLHDTTEPRAKVAQLMASEALRRDLERRDARDRRDRAFLDGAPKLLAEAGLEPRPGGVQKLLAELGVSDLRRKAEAAADPDERLSAERVLYALYIQTALYLPRNAMAESRWDRAIFYLETAAAIDPESPKVPYRLAAALAGKGDRAKALERLAKAVEMGGATLDELETDPALAPLRGEEGFRKLVARLRERS